MRECQHCFGVQEGTGALEVGDFVLAEETLHALCEGVDHSGFVLLGFAPVEANVACVDPEGLKLVVEFVVFVGDVEEGLRGNAAHVEAGPSQGASFLDADGVESELGGLDGCDVT